MPLWLRQSTQAYSALSLAIAITSIKRLLASRRHLKVLTSPFPLSTVTSIVVEPSVATTRSFVTTFCGSASYMFATWSWQNMDCLLGLIGLVPAAVTVGASNDGGVAVVSLVALQPASASATHVRGIVFFTTASPYCPMPTSISPEGPSCASSLTCICAIFVTIMAALAQHAKCQTENLPPRLMEGKSQAEAMAAAKAVFDEAGISTERAAEASFAILMKRILLSKSCG